MYLIFNEFTYNILLSLLLFLKYSSYMIFLFLILFLFDLDIIDSENLRRKLVILHSYYFSPYRDSLKTE